MPVLPGQRLPGSHLVTALPSVGLIQSSFCVPNRSTDRQNRRILSRRASSPVAMRDRLLAAAGWVVACRVGGGVAGCRTWSYFVTPRSARVNDTGHLGQTNATYRWVRPLRT